MSVGWSPKSHSLYPKNIRDIVKTVLLCQIRNQWKLPKDVMLLMLQHTVSACLMDMAKEEPKQNNEEDDEDVIVKLPAPSKSSRSRAKSESSIPTKKKKKHCILM